MNGFLSAYNTLFGRNTTLGVKEKVEPKLIAKIYAVLIISLFVKFFQIWNKNFKSIFFAKIIRCVENIAALVANSKIGGMFNKYGEQIAMYT